MVVFPEDCARRFQKVPCFSEEVTGLFSKVACFFEEVTRRFTKTACFFEEVTFWLWGSLGPGLKNWGIYKAWVNRCAAGQSDRTKGAMPPQAEILGESIRRDGAPCRPYQKRWPISATIFGRGQRAKG
jgi:hypothetical protein